MAAALQDWEHEVVDLKLKGLETSDIAAALDKHPATIRKAVARARDRGALADDRVLSSDEASATFGNEIPGQTTVDDHLPPEDDPEHADDDGDPLEEFPGEEPAGELDDQGPFVQGTRQMAIDFGAECPIVSKATLKFTSEKAASGFFGLGDEITGTFRATVTAAPGKLKMDKDLGEWVAAPTDYVATIEHFTVDAKAE